jgi:serine/threonine protein kinase
MRCEKRAPATLVLSDGREIEEWEEIGRGSLGAVYRGVLESGWAVRRPVAIKVFEIAPDDDAERVMRRLALMARRAACVSHPSVVDVLEVDRAGQQPYVVMELVDGESLAGMLKTWRTSGVRVPLDFAIVVTLRVAEALGAALFTDDTEGTLTMLAHGDLSPRQVLLSSRGEVKVGDFGQSALREGGSRVRSRDRLAYTAPEIAHGLGPDPRADVFSLGTMLHEMLVGPRFPPGTPPADAVRLVRGGRFHTSLLEPNLPRELRAIVERAIAPSPGNRYAHARAMAYDLRREAFRLGLSDAQTCVRHAVVGWCDVRGSEVPAPIKSEVVPAARARDDASDGEIDEPFFRRA